MPRIESRNTGDESMMVYLQRKHKIQSDAQQQTTSILDQVKFINKCSSYIDRKEQYQIANMLVNNQATKSSKNNIKKLRQCISNKFKKLMHINASLANSNKPNGLVAQLSGGKNPIRLVNFNYNEQIRVTETEPRQLKRMPSMKPMENNPRTVKKSSRASLHSNGSNGSSSSYSSSKSSEETEFFNSNQHLFSPRFVHIGCNHMGAETSTPLASSSAIHPHHTISSMPFLFDGDRDQCAGSCYCDECEDCVNSQAINMALFMDQSTQVPVDSPVLIESTFNNSSLSNLSDDLIIVQQTGVESSRPGHISTPTPSNYRKSLFQPTSASMRPQNGSLPFVTTRGVSLNRNTTPWL